MTGGCEPGTHQPGVLVMAKSPVPGQVKTRLATAIGARAAADVAAAALLDTLATVADSGMRCVVAWSGDLAHAGAAREIDRHLACCHVVPQRGEGLAERLTSAHRDASAALGGAAVVQIGMDTPQLTAGQLQRVAATLEGHDAALGLADDGGWWVLGVRTPALTAGLGRIRMSRRDTGRNTLRMLAETNASVALLEVLRDVDTLADAHAVLRHPACGARFAAAFAAMSAQP